MVRFLIIALCFLVTVTPSLGAADLPLRILTSNEIPIFEDDLNFANMELAIDRQLSRFAEKDLTGTFVAGGLPYPRIRLKESLIEFRSLLKKNQLCTNSKCAARFRSLILQKFDVFAPDLKPEDPRYGEPESAFFTGYYTPTLKVTSKPSPPFIYPIFNKPSDPKFSKLSRQEIDFQDGLKGKGLEIGYASDLFDVYLLHIQGGGKLVFETEKIVSRLSESPKYISYSGSNGLAYKAIGKYMQEKGYIKDTLIPFQKAYLDANPNQWEEIFSSCPNYVFFEESKQPPWGVDRVPLTDNRSMATDHKLYPEKGMLTFVRTYRPASANFVNPSFRPFSRFLIDQDTGGAIKGKARADIFYGEDEYAKTAAYNIRNRGELFFLLLKP